MRKRLKRKRRSCSICKPQKTGGCDKRDIKQKRQDEKDRCEQKYSFKM